ncbi:MAG: helix-turn-helix domain-containing protein [Nanoarchaeota archaeon]|nr:helix-turn-helix domain-containing protein [Nanoarchaeota archaeon]
MVSKLYNILCSHYNLKIAFEKARKRKTKKQYVSEFEGNLRNNLIKLHEELVSQTYKPQPLKTFILRDPKTRKISKSHFKDRVIHHALCNIIEPIFDKTFIYDSYANRRTKGTHKAIQRFDYFKRKASKNNTKTCFVLKADIKHYFETVNHNILVNIIKRKIKDKKVIELIKTILSNYNTKIKSKGMPLGNLTSQFFANIYLNELDQFVKHKLKAKYYIRYVDDFVILSSSKDILESYKEKITKFLIKNLDLELHPDKSKIKYLYHGIDFLGFRVFYYHKLITKKNNRKFNRKYKTLKQSHKKGKINREKIIEKLEGWLAYISYGNTYKYKRNLIKNFNRDFPLQTKITNSKKIKNFNNKIKLNKFKFSSLKTLYLFKKGLTIEQISKKRNIKESTVWEHLTKLIEHNQLSIYRVLPKEKINKIISNIRSKYSKLKDIKERLKDDSISFNEISCVLSSVKCKNKNV